MQPKDKTSKDRHHQTQIQQQVTTTRTYMHKYYVTSHLPNAQHCNTQRGELVNKAE